MQLGAAEVTTPLPSTLAYWRDFAVRYVTALCGYPDPATDLTAPPEAFHTAPTIPPPPDAASPATVAVPCGDHRESDQPACSGVLYFIH